MTNQPHKAPVIPMTTLKMDKPCYQDQELALANVPVPDEACFYGILGQYANYAANKQETTPIAILAHLLPFIGTYLCKPYACPPQHLPKTQLVLGGVVVPPRVMTVIVGLSSAGKGTAATQTKLLTRCINKALLDLKLPVPIYADGPMSTGEGLAWLLRDESKDLDKDNNPKFEGVDDKRAMIVEEEFSACLKATKRDGNTFSAAIRRFYDDGCYSPIVKTAKATCTHADLSFCGHITPSELLKEIDPQEFYNGFANRILWFYVPHSEIVPIPLSPSDSALQAFTDEIVQAIQYSHHQTNLTLSDESIRLWENVAKRLGKARNQMLGERARPNVLRIATIYALLDKTNQVQPEHLKAAIALWEYNQQSINYIFEMQQDDRELDISRVLTGRELSISEIRLTAFNQNISSSDLGQLLKRMEGRGLIERFERPNVTGKGKKATCFRLKAVKE